jgi:aspartate/methionine/tyrosine aminotransferase
MKFADFQQLRIKILNEQKNVLDCAETNLYSALARLIPKTALAPVEGLHRCHLAEKWVQHYGFRPEMAHHALVSCGIRDSLALLFRYYADKHARLWLPIDNYPVYGELAIAAQLTPQVFPTLPEPIWPDVAPESSPELLVVTNPLKPLGRWLTAQDVAALTAWLAASSQRRLLLDTVYAFDVRFHSTTLQLFSTGQTFLLHSLTKGWLQPRLFGVTLVPEADLRAFMPVFRNHLTPQANLARARDMLTDYPDMPGIVAHEIAAAQERLISALPARFPARAPVDAPSYLTPICGHWLELLKNANVLGIPATVFGSPRKDITILSNLIFLE